MLGTKKSAVVNGSRMTYIEHGEGDPIVFQHPVPKLFGNADPGSILTGRARELCRTSASQREVTVPGSHFVPEDGPAELGAAVAEFVRGVRV